MNKTELAYYGNYAEILQNIEVMMLNELNEIISQISEDIGYSPVEHIRSRIKSADSVQSKLRRLNKGTDVHAAIEELSDIIGIRVIAHFVGDVYSIAEKIQSSSCWNVIQIKDYISHPKENGYRSLHIILQFPIDFSLSDGTQTKYMNTEIQLRTIAMDCWASLEHEIKYKKDIPNHNLIVNELKRCANEMASTDLSMQTIHDMIYSESGRKEIESVIC